MALTLSIVASVLFGLAGWWMKISQMNKGSIRTLMIGMYAIGSLCFAIHSAIEGSFITLLDYRALILGLIIGIGSGFGNYMFMLALERGPASLISPLSNTNIILVVLLGVIIYGERLGLIQVISVILLLVATMLISQKKAGIKNTQKSWLWLTLIAIILFTARNGGIKIAEEMSLASAPILFIAYFLSFIIFLSPRFSNGDARKSSSVIGLKWGIITGMFSYAGLQLFAVAMSFGQASIVAPVFATNGLIVTIGSILVYKERLTALQYLSFVFLIVGLIGIRFTL